jgi:hypothetical protein
MEVLQNNKSAVASNPVRERKSKKQPKRDFSSFDRPGFMHVETTQGVLLNSTRAMLNSGNRPSEIAAILYRDYGQRLRKERNPDPVRDKETMRYFAGLVLPCGVPCILDGCGGHA